MVYNCRYLVDWNDDGETDLFILDQDGYIRYYENSGESDLSFNLKTTSFFVSMISTPIRIFSPERSDLDDNTLKDNANQLAGFLDSFG